MAFWERAGEALVGEELFTATDIDFTVVITVVVPCEPEDYRCVVVNSQGTRRSGITICNEGECVPIASRGSYRILPLGGGEFFGIVNITCVKQRLCKSRPCGGVWVHASPPENLCCPEIESGGFWQLADYPCSKLQHFNT